MKDQESFVDYDQVHKPAHYAQDRTIEPISVIEDWFPDGTDGAYHKGNALKYLSRAGRKLYEGKTQVESEIIDLEKQVWYVQRRIQQLRKLIEDAEHAPISSGQEHITDA